MPVEASRATELFRLAASDAQQSFEVNCWCYARAMRIAGLLLLNGAPPQDLGWSVICSPPAWLHERGRRPVMTAPAVDGYSLKILLGGRNETIFEDYLFRRIATTGGGDVAIYKRDGAALTRPGNTEPLSYRFADFNCESWWDNHIAPTLLVREDEDGPASTVVIDPEIGESPLSPSEWRARQDSLDLTCLIAIDWSGVASIDRTCSSRETLDAMIDANRRRHGDECDDSDLIAFLSDGEILDAHFDNPYDPRLSEGEVRSSTLEIFEHFGAWLAPLAAFKRWRARAIAATIEAEKARDRL